MNRLEQRKKNYLFIRHLFDSNVYIPSAVDEGKFVSFFVHLVRSFTLISRMIFTLLVILKGKRRLITTRFEYHTLIVYS